MTAATEERAGGRAWQFSAEALALLEKFPPRPVPASWPGTRQSRGKVVARLLAPPFEAAGSQDRCNRKLALLKVLDWLELHPGRTWQERWDHAVSGGDDWRDAVIRELSAAGNLGSRGGRLFKILGPGVTQLITADVIRPSLGWLMTTPSPQRIANESERVRDPAGFARLREVRDAGTFGNATVVPALEKVALILAVKGGTVEDITVGDCLELVRTSRELFPGPSRTTRHSPFFYQVLHAAGIFPAAAPQTVRMFSSVFAGQLTVEQMIDRYDLACRPVRDLLVDYLRERQPALDYNSLTTLATTLGLWFWKDLENCHPGIGSLRLAPDIAAAWKQRIRIKPVRGQAGRDGATEERKSATDILITVRAFYLDLAQWALDDPARWGPWAVPCPVRSDDVQYRKMASRRKARMDQRTRERLPVMPALAAAAGRNRRDAAARLKAASEAEPGGTFTAAGVTMRRAVLHRPSPRVWAEDPRDGKRRDLTREEDNAFWAWAAVEVLRLTGIRIEELTELSHHSLVQYRVPSTGELVPLLSVAPSKTDRGETSRRGARAGGRSLGGHLPDPHPRRQRPARDRLRPVRENLEPADAAAVPAPRRPRGPAHPDLRHPHPDHPGARRRRDHRRRREADRHGPPRFPEGLRHGGHPERDAAAHRPADTRTQRYKHDNGLQSRLSRGGDQRAPGVPRPTPGTAAQRGIPYSDRRRMGRVPRPLRAPPCRTRRLRACILIQLHP